MPLQRRARAAGKADPARTLGLVVEGGGCRGIYAAGVLDMLLEAKLRVGSVLGVSAGAIHRTWRRKPSFLNEGGMRRSPPDLARGEDPRAFFRHALQ